MEILPMNIFLKSEFLVTVFLWEGVWFTLLESLDLYTKWQYTLYESILQGPQQGQTMRNRISYISSFWNIVLLLLGIFKDLTALDTNLT